MSEVRTAQRLIWLVVIVLLLDLWRRSSGVQPALNHGHPPSLPEPPSKGSSLLNAPVKNTANNNGFLPNWGQGIKWAGLSAGKVINAGAWLLPCFLTGSCSASPFRDSQLEKGLLTASALQRESKFQSLKSEFEKGGNKLDKNEFATTGRMKDKESTFGGFASSTVISGPPHDPSPSGTLVIYLYRGSDPHHNRNFEFFLKHGVEGDEGNVDHIIVVQLVNTTQMPQLPSLPRNARYLFHNSSCFDWGVYGWALNSDSIDTSAYQYIILMNSSVRGPFMPPYLPASVYWHTIFTSRLTARVKLVGPTISCGIAHMAAVGRSPARSSPHVQSYLLATDQVGLGILRADPNVFRCHKTLEETTLHSELGASAAIMAAGYNLDSLMLKYQGVDWRQKGTIRGCNRGVNPLLDGHYDGISVNPMEVLFVKVEGTCLTEASQCGDAAEAAVAYDRFVSNKGSVEMVVSRKEPAQTVKERLKPLFKLPHIDDWTLAEACVDFTSYRNDHEDLRALTHQQAVRHFLELGQREMRTFKIKSDAKRCVVEFLNNDGNDRGVAAHLSLGPVLEQRVQDIWTEEGLQTTGGN